MVKKSVKILYLYSEVMGYTVATLRALVIEGAELHVVHWDEEGKKTPFQINGEEGITFYKRSDYDIDTMLSLFHELDPTIVVVSGWMDSVYLSVSRVALKLNKKVVVGMDNHWKGGVRQRLGCVLARAGWRGRYFTHAWTPGVCQYEFARRMGFPSERILSDLYSADSEKFNFLPDITSNDDGPRQFLFVGRLEPVKNLKALAEAWNLLGPDRKEWTLCIVGAGSLKSHLESYDGVTVKSFMSAENLALEAQKSSCFVLPSVNEPWGVVIHEFAAAGLPIICSDICGAAKTFLIPGANGFTFQPDDRDSIMRAMKRMISLSAIERSKMGAVSRELSTQISSKRSALRLLSLLHDR
jgi:glycosyltransferase involved in cell wall biosynthesis